VGAGLLKEKGRSLKFLLNDSAIVFFPANQQHREVKLAGLSYEDNYRGNALAGLVTAGHVEIRFHSAFTDERVRNIWSRVSQLADLAAIGLGSVYYQARKL